MQELISQVEELGIEINHTTSLVMIFGIIFITAIILAYPLIFCQQPYVAFALPFVDIRKDADNSASKMGNDKVRL